MKTRDENKKEEEKGKEEIRKRKKKKKEGGRGWVHQDILLIYHTGTPKSEIFIIRLCSAVLCRFRCDVIEAT